MKRIDVAVMAGTIGQPVGDVILSMRKRYPRKRIVALERGSLTVRPRDPLRLEVHYDANGVVYEVREG